LAYSIATMGCNFHCRHCQNCHLSRTPADTGRIEGRSIPPEKMVAEAKASGCGSLSYTYSEPTIYAELALDTAKIAKREGLYNTFVTNGYESPALIERMDGLIDAANIDLKSFSKENYKKISGAKLSGVLDSIQRMFKIGMWIEITTLLIPGLNDSKSEVEEIAAFIADLSRDIPWHISRYHPAYQMHDRPVTPHKNLTDARKIGYQRGLKYVYTGNVPGDEGENTYCHGCGEILISRIGFTVNRNRLKDGVCPGCGAKAAGRFG
jgi:pyruvate formate lyase activating enzyme